ncbi:AMP-binding protein [Halioglobus japonicus]|uniref:AMP-binding protein n=1 Tax=Halioglobus japonicus TaxID=930805 RepID=A0AAP8MHG9_9GAMM|nr:class I adenylate-forming enzyme family protein [Halioglobus japonicus]AQA19078.1 AMP-binding protein [Halioglobus japonicus]PLW87898.1 AMP-binding protein [Halioglobus japonicus]GHD05958.1 fatty acid--CoA ligase [Halioglobus japonicus]
MSVNGAAVSAKKAELTASGAFFEVGPIEVEGREYQGYKHAPATALEVLNNARNHGALDFLVYEDSRYTYTRLFAEADALAAQLQGDYEIEKGDRVAIAMRNNAEWMITYCAATLIGAIVVPINSWGKREELEYAISDCKASLLVCDEARFHLIEADYAALNISAIVVPTSADFQRPSEVALFDDVVSAGEDQSYTAPNISPDDGAIILYTSGSTGFPKGVLHRHRSIGQALMNMMFLGLLVAEFEGGPREYRGGAERETPMLTVPLFHATGLLGGFYLPMMLGQKVVMMYKWDSSQALALIEQERVTGVSTVPAILQDLLNNPDFERYDTSSLMRISAAGAATPAGLPELIDARIEDPSRSAGYGMTETMAVGATMSGALFDFRPDSAGVISPIMEMRFVAANGEETASGEPGEIQMRGICCTQGYWEKPDANADTFSKDGWMSTGDVGKLDEEGFLYITGRIKEIVIRGGENIFPGEIEQAAYELSSVREVVVFGEPDEAMGEEMVMVAFPEPDSGLEEATLRDFLKGRLAGYKVPRTIVLSDSALPRNASEKLHKLKVKEAYLGN